MNKITSARAFTVPDILRMLAYALLYNFCLLAGAFAFLGFMGLIGTVASGIACSVVFVLSLAAIATLMNRWFWLF